ncbi:hypothetical protein F5879DRAFT_992671 [Lentinula edodes]|nr:hypothetical protein F5879DRAFT_992671 [Lentinula edodes]
MSALIKTILPTGKLSAKLEGIDIPAGLRLPELEMVLKDAAEVTTMMSSPLPPTEGRTRTEESTGILPDALAYNTSLPQLFEFSYFFPLKILPECIWALEWYIRALTDGSELQVRIWPYSSSSVCESSSVLHELNGSGISKPELDEPLEALRHLRAAIDADQEQVGGTGDMWKENPGLFFVQSVALARSRTDDDKAKETLSRIINDKNIDKGSQGMILLVKSKIYLSQVLRRLGEEQDAQSHEQWLIKWLKENPHRLPDSTLVEIFTTDTNIKEDPILTGLGGEKWLNNRRHTHKTDVRLTRVCRHCQAREPQVKLSQCSLPAYLLLFSVFEIYNIFDPSLGG